MIFGRNEEKWAHNSAGALIYFTVVRIELHADDPNPMTRETNEAWPQLLEQAVDLLKKFSIPLYVYDRYGRPEQFGTGFIVRRGELHFLVSAAHVLDRTQSTGVFFYSTPKTLRSLTGRVLTTGHPDRRNDDLLDVGVIKLAGAGMPPYQTVDKLPMDISYLRPSYLPRSGKHYVIVGFPATKSRVNTEGGTALVSPYAYHSDPVAESVYEAQGVDARTHVALPLDLRKGTDPHGRIRTFPKPQGMSGSPIIVLYDEAEVDRSPTPFPVVAVGTRYRSEPKVLIGTDVRFVIGAIEQLSVD